VTLENEYFFRSILTTVVVNSTQSYVWTKITNPNFKNRKYYKLVITFCLWFWAITTIYFRSFKWCQLSLLSLPQPNKIDNFTILVETECLICWVYLYEKKICKTFSWEKADCKMLVKFSPEQSLSSPPDR